MVQLKSEILIAREEKENGCSDVTNSLCLQTWVGVQEKLEAISPNSNCRALSHFKFLYENIIFFRALQHIELSCDFWFYVAAEKYNW